MTGVTVISSCCICQKQNKNNRHYCIELETRNKRDYAHVSSVTATFHSGPPSFPFSVPTAPRFTVEACIAERNVITLVWQPTSSTLVTKYTLELDDGANGNFRVSKTMTNHKYFSPKSLQFCKCHV